MNDTTLAPFYMMIKATLVTGTTTTRPIKSPMQAINSCLTEQIYRRCSTSTMTIRYNTDLYEKRSC